MARDIARHHGARLTLLHVDGLPVYNEHVRRAASSDAWIKYFQARNVELKERLREFAQSLELGKDTELALSRGDPAKAIQKQAAGGFDLVVMSPHGTGYGARFLLGSVSARVATEANCPVLVAHSRSGAEMSSDGAFERPLIAVSDERLAQRAVALTMSLAERGTKVDLMHVLEAFEIPYRPGPPGFHEALLEGRHEVRKKLARLAGRLEKRGFDTSIRVETGDPAYAILCRLEASRSGLVVVCRKTPAAGEAGLSVPVYRAVQHSPIPVLVVPEPVNQA